MTELVPQRVGGPDGVAHDALAAAQLPALLEASEHALAIVTEASDAEVEWRQAKALEHVARLAKVNADVRLRAGRAQLRWEYRWGELLGDGYSERESDRLSDSVYAARRRARELAAVDRDLVDAYLERVRDPELLRRTRLLRLQRERDADRRRAEATATTWRAGDVELRHGDLRTTLGDLTGQVDAIITDPPYAAGFLPEYEALGELAADILAPEGLLVAMVGQAHLPGYLERLGRHLTYRWCAAYLAHGPATRVHGRDVGTKWKPLLIFDRAGERRFLTQDVFTASDGRDKRHHVWGQSESGTAEIVERMTRPGALVADPFLGAGTTAVVCRDLGRRFVGCDIDAAAIETARRRLAA